MKIEAENAEQPVVSADGELLAFLREERGRNSLWIRWIKTREGPGNSANDQLVAGPNYDAREVAFFADDSMIFSARRDGRFRLHKTVIGSGVIQEMNTPACSARFPAVSPDGLWLAFSCEQGGSWQIQVMNLNTQNQMRLTNSDCNSVSPVWTPDSKDVIYATDCGRGLGLTALAQLHVFR